MFLRKYWIPLSVLIVAIVGVSLYYLQTRPPKDPVLIVKPVEFEKPAAEAPIVDQPEQVGHVHEDGTWHDGPHKPVEQPSTDELDTSKPVASPAPTGPLTYHASLLASHPVEALRAQAEERAHWSAKWIPPFPSDDHEAAAFARHIYLIVYYISTGETDTPKAAQNRAETLLIQDNIMDKGYSPRRSDLLKLTWAGLQAGDIDTTFFRPSNFDYSLDNFKN